MGTEPNYICSLCKTPTTRDLLTAKKAVFMEMGERAKTLRSRVVHWLCPSCIAADTDWNQPKYSTPFTSTPEAVAQ
jgi:hypothetical protein